MRYVIIRDDDTNALTPIECLERLYRPFLDRGLPVNLATIPEVATDTRLPDGRPEGFLRYRNGTTEPRLPIDSNKKLVTYLSENPRYHIVQHGFHHNYLEFENPCARIVGERLDRGREIFQRAGFAVPETFVAPYDKLSRPSLRAVAKRFSVLSTGWFELRRLPYSWWPRYLFKKLRGAAHWRIGHTALLSHPGCILSCFRNYTQALPEIQRQIKQRRLTVLVTHWWEYFREDHPDEPFIRVLHQTAEYLASDPEIQVITFRDLSASPVASIG
jgi:hypothetical protein